MKNTAEESTITYDRNVIEANANNIYEAIVIMGKRSEQINEQVKEELTEKLEEFASHTETLEEVFENREQIEVSRHYEKLPKPSSVAIAEWLNEEIYLRRPEDDLTEF